MKSIFNSLGSNYTFKFALTALSQIFVSASEDHQKLNQYLEDNYHGKSFLFYKGRDAIEFSIRVLSAQKKSQDRIKILTQAFTCYAVEEGIKRGGGEPVYVDIAENSTNLTVQTLQASFKSNPDSKVVLVQHSLGIPAEIGKISAWCKKNNLLLIEDLAQSIGGRDSLGQSLGYNADVVIFSFGRDKVIDSISGGAVVFKELTNNQLKVIQEIIISQQTKKYLFIDLIYPIVTYLGRNLYDVWAGKLIIKLAKTLKLITSPTISQIKNICTMSPAYSTLALVSLGNLESQIIHRRKIANLYLEKIVNKKISIINSKEDVLFGSNLRFSIRIQEVEKFIQLMKKNKIFLSDRWYRNPVDCGRYQCDSFYTKGLAPNAEKLSSEIINLPTHINLSIKQANQIIKTLNDF
ncbi:MAG: DegT/DnrJ/EryC1/StrS aminotransferase family protein [Pseudomonadales bacterium]|nr:DegT/DnrJ/EryC1/StrS aminotransferase family protein [Pseudomonadales bacterium]